MNTQTHPRSQSRNRLPAQSGKITNLDMGKEQAQEHVRRIAVHLQNAEVQISQARNLIWELHEYNGWKALGYKSWRACCLAEFEQCGSMLYKELRAAQVELEIAPGSAIGTIGERVLRPLTKKGYTVEARTAIWDIAQTMVGEGGHVTSGIVQTLADGLEEMIASGATQDADGKQTPLANRIKNDLLERALQIKIAHKEHKISRMNAKRNYILGGREVETCARATLNGISKANLTIALDSDLEVDKLSEAMKAGKKIYMSLWTEETPAV